MNQRSKGTLATSIRRNIKWSYVTYEVDDAKSDEIGYSNIDPATDEVAIGYARLIIEANLLQSRVPSPPGGSEKIDSRISLILHRRTYFSDFGTKSVGDCRTM